MTSSVTKWLSNLSNKPENKGFINKSNNVGSGNASIIRKQDVVGADASKLRATPCVRRRPLSAQSTLESLSIRDAPPSPTLSLFESGKAISSSTGQRGTNNGGGGGGTGGGSGGGHSSDSSSASASIAQQQASAASQQQHTRDALIAEGNASLNSLFSAISPYVSSADIRCSNGSFRRLYDGRGPVVFSQPPLQSTNVGGRGEVRLWDIESERIISQNSSNRRVHRCVWVNNPHASGTGGGTATPRSPAAVSNNDRLTTAEYPAALKFVEDYNSRDGRSLKREIECHIYTYQKLTTLYQMEIELRQKHLTQYSYTRMPEWAVVEKLEDAWPCAELYGYHLDRRNPGKSVLLTRKLSGPDLFDVIRAEHNHNWHFHHNTSGGAGDSVGSGRCRVVYSHRHPAAVTSSGTASLSMGATGGAPQVLNGCVYYPQNYEYHKLRWCALALHRLSQYGMLCIRHNDVKPDNIVLDFHHNSHGFRTLDVKLIDLGTASMYNAKDFTGGTSWYESPEQKLLEYFMKKKKNADAAKRVHINLSSDIWGAGISLTEVLIGKRIVDNLKTPNGPGSLEYLGGAVGKRATGRGAAALIIGASAAAENRLDFDYIDSGGEIENYPYWAVEPSEWLLCARKALGLDRNNNNSVVASSAANSTKLSHEAAKWLFDNLVIPDHRNRMPLNIALEKLETFAEEAYQRYRYQTTSFQQRLDSYQLPK